MDLIVITTVTLIIARYLIHNIIKMLCRAESRICITSNYKGKRIPAIGGIVFVPIQLAAVFQLLLQRPEHSYGYLSYMFLMLSMGFAGVIDDLAGDKRIKGLINHVRSTLKSNMTTGFLKALIGFLAACTISFRTAGSLVELAADVLVITLSANAINLFDMRPGRAVKVFLAISIMILFSSAGRPAEALPLIILVMTVLIYMSYDLREICMLGDTGANILGISLGYYSTLFLSFSGKLMLLVLLILLNIAAERLSISALINNSRILSYLDSLGRGRTDNR